MRYQQNRTTTNRQLLTQHCKNNSAANLQLLVIASLRDAARTLQLASNLLARRRLGGGFA
ncbi:MAG: hypothetical protein V7K77_31715 [Nostoc sp.]|uniref:hypothetical protein n=1 Tax=Nostoc sp. TaxID=1180 RepID=UPI002FF97B50